MHKLRQALLQAARSAALLAGMVLQATTQLFCGCTVHALKQMLKKSGCVKAIFVQLVSQFVFWTIRFKPKAVEPVACLQVSRSLALQ
jgi:hypothetical protein